MPKIEDETGNPLINSIDSNPPSLEYAFKLDI